MIILSFDIGIKNLAFSLLKIKDGKLEKIYDWGVVNLIQNEQNKHTCAVPNCKNNSKKSLGRGDKRILFCKNNNSTF